MIVKKIIYDWFYTTESGEEYGIAEVGRDGVIKIEEHQPSNAGDKLYYDIFFDTGEIVRIINISSVVYNKK